jgi:AraC-like DNA-binding protein
MLGLTAEQVTQLAREGSIPAVRNDGAWCFPLDELQHWLADCGSQPQSVDEACDSLDTVTFNIVHADDMDHYRAQPGNWNVQVSKLSKGRFHSHIRSIQFPGITVYDNHWGAASQVLGQSPDGWLMLGGVVEPERAGFHWNGKKADRGYFACSGEGEAIEFSMDPQAYDIVLLIRPDLLRQTAGSGASELIQQSKHLDFGLACGGQLLDVAGDLINGCEAQPLLLGEPAIAARARSKLLRALEDCFSHVLPETAAPPRLREQAVHSAIVHVSGALRQTSAWDMAQAAGVSQKTLETAFKQVLGMTPGKYLVLSRLNAAHHELADGRADELSVTQTAIGWGFTHQGRFSAAYRQLFGELPSQTLMRPARLT